MSAQGPSAAPRRSPRRAVPYLCPPNQPRSRRTPPDRARARRAPCACPWRLSTDSKTRSRTNNVSTFFVISVRRSAQQPDSKLGGARTPQAGPLARSRSPRAGPRPRRRTPELHRPPSRISPAHATPTVFRIRTSSGGRYTRLDVAGRTPPAAPSCFSVGSTAHPSCVMPPLSTPSVIFLLVQPRSSVAVSAYLALRASALRLSSLMLAAA